MRILLLLAAICSLSAASFQVEIHGTKGAPAMILIPGLASSGEVWAQTVARYGPRYECHVLTLAGFAGVPAAEKQPGFLLRVRLDLAAYIKANKLRQPTLLGHSLGGFVALSLAAAEPSLAGDLVIVDALPALAAVFPAAFDPAPMRDRILAQSRAEYEEFIRSGASLRPMVTSPAHLQRLQQWSLQSDQWTVAHAMFELYNADIRAELPNVRSRTLILGSWFAMKDFTTRDAVEANFRKQYAPLPRHRFALSNTGRHFLMYDDPDWFFSQIDQFLTPEADPQ